MSVCIYVSVSLRVCVCIKLIRACLDIAALRHNNNFSIFFFPIQLLAATRIFNYRLGPFVYSASHKTTRDCVCVCAWVTRSANCMCRIRTLLIAMDQRELHNLLG